MHESEIHTDNMQEYADYLSDESRHIGCADSISFPKSEAEVLDHVRWAFKHKLFLTLQCGLTGLAGGATPEGGHILNLSRMTRMLGLRRDADGVFYVRVQPGCTLKALAESLKQGDFDTDAWSDESIATLDEYRQSDPCVFPPDLTEAGACIAGVVANNGSGARTYRYGPTRPHVSALHVMLVDGDMLKLVRGNSRAIGRTFALKTDSGRTLSGTLPSYTMPAVKNAAGFFAEDDMDLIDLFIGSEGTLGVISEIEIRLTPAPKVVLGITAFLPVESAALDFVIQVRDTVGTPVAAIEYFSAEALDLLRKQRAENPAFKGLPELRPEWHTAIYVELHGDDEDLVEHAVEVVSDILADCGGDVDATWFADSARDIERFKGVRHAVPEAVNLLIAERKKLTPGLTKLGTDLSVPDQSLRDVMAMYHHDLRDEELDYVIFGHIGNNHVHVNILPKTIDEYNTGKELYHKWAQRVVVMGGSVSAEHGIGKLKTGMLEIMVGAKGINEMRAVKKVFDPNGILNRGTLFRWEGNVS